MGWRAHYQAGEAHQKYNVYLISYITAREQKRFEKTTSISIQGKVLVVIMVAILFTITP